MRSSLVPLLRRSVISTRSGSSALRGGASPPLPPFTRIPAPSQKLAEQGDCVFDDGVAPELALDFDCQHISSTESLLSWLGGLSFFAGLYYYIKNVQQPEPPAANRKMHIVVPAVPKGKPESA